MTREQLVSIAKDMSPDDRAYIVAELDADEATADQATPAFDADGWSPAVPAELRAELIRRMVAYDADPSRGITLEQFRARVADGQ